jgi:hypothetical protein
MKNFWMIVKQVVKKSDIILLVLDARFPEMSNHPELESKAGTKPIIYVLNKCDLVSKEEVEKSKKLFRHCVFISSRDHLGTTMLKKKIMEVAKGEKVTVGVVGYPNTGKSSMINALRGRKGASTSAMSGHTKGKQLLKVSEKIYILDTPGVLPYMEDDEIKLALIGAIDFSKVKEPDMVAMVLIEEKKDLICEYYDVENKGDSDEVLEAIALRHNKLKKKAELDTDAAARMIIKDWQRGKIKARP